MSGNATPTFAPASCLPLDQSIEQSIRHSGNPTDAPLEETVEEIFRPGPSGERDEPRQATLESGTGSSPAPPNESLRNDTPMEHTPALSTSSVPSPIEIPSTPPIANVLPTPRPSEGHLGTEKSRLARNGVSSPDESGDRPITSRVTSDRLPSTVDSVREDRADAASRPESVSDGSRRHSAANQDNESARPPLRHSPDPEFWTKLGEAFQGRDEWPDILESMMATCRRAVETRLTFVSAQVGRGHIEVLRLKLLQEACEKADMSYLLIHQLYCCSHIATTFPEGRALDQVSRDRAQNLRHSLATNDVIPADAVFWFSRFPGPPPVPGSDKVPGEMATRWYEEALLAISCIAKHWDPLVRLCHLRRFPPLTSELWTTFQIRSSLLQQIVLRAILRGFIQPNDDRFGWLEAISAKDQQYHREMQRNNVEPVNAKAHDSSIAQQYFTILTPDHSHRSSRPEDRPLRPSSADSNQRNLLNRRTAPLRPIPASLHVSTGRTHPGLTASPASNRVGISNAMTEEPNIPRNTTYAVQNDHRSAVLRTGVSDFQPRSHQNRLTNNPSRLPSSSQYVEQLEGFSAFQQIENLNPVPAQHRLGSNHPNASLIQTAGGYSHAQPVTQVNGWISNQQHPIQINPDVPYLHQTHLMTPTLLQSSLQKCFMYVKDIHRVPQPLDQFIPYSQHAVGIDQAQASLTAQDMPISGSLVASRLLAPGSMTYRMRCVKWNETKGYPSNDALLLADHAWPPNIAILFNEQALEFRRKVNHSKDLPVDVTRNIQPGENVIKAAIMNVHSGSNDQYYLAMEAITMATSSAIKDLVAQQDLLTSKERITAKLNNVDPDVEALDDKLTIDMTDPFSAIMFHIPVRGRSCQHDQCFDLETFLETRGSTAKSKDEPCPPDEFRCPICKGDARPQALVIDSFLKDIRKQLESIDRLDAKAIQIDKDGHWAIKEEEEAAGESGDGDGRRRKRTSEQRETLNAASMEVIEID